MKEPNIEMCVEEAITFLKVAERLEDDEETIFGGIFPFVVNVALSCELFLKSIIMINSNSVSNSVKIIKEHKLTKLFCKLPKDDQIKIKDSFSKRMKCDFDELIAEMNDTFVKWRYAYEQGNLKINITGILTLAQVLNDYITEQYLDEEE